MNMLINYDAVQEFNEPKIKLTSDYSEDITYIGVYPSGHPPLKEPKIFVCFDRYNKHYYRDNMCCMSLFVGSYGIEERVIPISKIKKQLKIFHKVILWCNKRDELNTTYAEIMRLRKFINMNYKILDEYLDADLGLILGLNNEGKGIDVQYKNLLYKRVTIKTLSVDKLIEEIRCGRVAIENFEDWVDEITLMA